MVLAFAGLTIAFGMWWIYFLKPVFADLNNSRTAIAWGYGHYLVFAAAAAFPAGLELAIDYDLQQAGEANAESAVQLNGLTTAMLTTVAGGDLHHLPPG